MYFRKIIKFLQFDTVGWIATSALLLCTLSGIFLAIPYDFTRAHPSVSELLLMNAPGKFIRNLHYWSAQLFLIFTILHIYDHLSKSTETNIKKRRSWIILTIVLIFLGYEMISGFILKGDAAGIQARRIIANLIATIPLIGDMLKGALTGTDSNWQIIYIQHVSTGTIFVFIGVYDHARKIWPKLKTFLVMFFILLAISLLFRAPLGQPESSQLKGPWFFVGIQELLHYTTYPGLIVFLLFVLLVLFFLLPIMKNASRQNIKKILLAIGVSYLLITMIVLLFRGENWQWKSSVSEEPLFVYDPVNLFDNSNLTFLPSNQKNEGCMLCHSSMTGLSESHNPAFIGCYSCHKGDPFSAKKEVAHAGMYKVPGDFSNVMQTCGTSNCHPDFSERVQKSLMTTQSGIIAVDKFVFGEAQTLNDSFQIKNLGYSAADIHLRNLCAGCHLGNQKLKTGNVAWLERGGGCNACHLHYNKEALVSLKQMHSGTNVKYKEVHPSIDIQVTNDRCLSCHSRSGRISLSYEGWNETDLKKSEVTDSIIHLILPDDRVLEFVQADVHHQKGMACIDCHGSYDLMGDGKSNRHKEEAVSIQCTDCHTDRKPKTSLIVKLPDRESVMVAWLRKYNTKTKVALMSKSGFPIINSKVDSLGQLFIIGKLDNMEHLSKPPSAICNRGKGHERLSCEACHTAWVPNCIGCHNSYEKETAGLDLLTNQPTKGTWVEYEGKNYPRRPTLGLNEKSGKVVTVMPGMVLSINKASFGNGKEETFHRLFAPASGHTTTREGRSCKSCHNNPAALGYGDGQLSYKDGKWQFEPKFIVNQHDGLPEDAWTGFLKAGAAPYATRNGLRPFTVEEQKRILLVGTCLNCHEEKSVVMVRALEDFEKTLLKRSKKCW